MIRIVCVSCQMFYRPAKCGVMVDEQAAYDNGAEYSYRLWSADKLACPGCGHEIAAGFGAQPFAEHYEHGYEAKRAAARELVVAR